MGPLRSAQSQTRLKSCPPDLNQSLAVARSRSLSRLAGAGNLFTTPGLERRMQASFMACSMTARHKATSPLPTTRLDSESMSDTTGAALAQPGEGKQICGEKVSRC